MKKFMLTISVFCFFILTGYAQSGSGNPADTVSVQADTTGNGIQDWNTPVKNNVGLTALAAAKSVFGDGEASGTEFVVATKKIFKVPGAESDSSVVPAGGMVQLPEVVQVKSEGVDYLVFLWEGVRKEGYSDRAFGERFSILSVFTLNGSVCADAFEVKTDELTFFSEDPLLKLGQNDAFSVINHHANSGQAYYTNTLWCIQKGALKQIAEISTMDVMSGCAESFRENIQWQTKPGKHQNNPDIILSVDLIHAPAEFMKDCVNQVESNTEKFEADYIWDAVKESYILFNTNTNVLDKWNEDHM